MFEVGSDFICLHGRIYYRSPSEKELPCQDCDFRHDFGEMDCSCLCTLLNCSEKDTLKEVFSNLNLILHS